MPGGAGHARANLAVDLNDERDLVDAERAIVGLEIALQVHRRRVPKRSHSSSAMCGANGAIRSGKRVHGVQQRRRRRLAVHARSSALTNSSSFAIVAL